ncbi:MAG TPA: hypothetical protein VIB48_11320 [Acidimicrobiia bacterium]
MRRRSSLEHDGALALGGAAAFLVPWISHASRRPLPSPTTSSRSGLP